MGLDQYLIRKKKNIKDADKYDIVAYWRKANAIQNYVVTNFIKDENWNGADFKLTEAQLIELSDKCKEVLSKVHLIDGTVHNGDHLGDNGEWIPNLVPGKVVDHPEICEELLPTVDGFFFGSLDYDEYYIHTLEETIKQIDKVLRETDFDEETISYSAWW